MEFEIDKNLFLTSLLFAQKFTSSKLSTTQILQGVYLTTIENRLKITTTNLNETFETTINCKTIKTGDTIININKLVSFLSLVSAKSITIKQQENLVNITKEKTTVLFETYSVNDFPKINNVLSKKQTEIKTEDQQNINKVLFSASHEQNRPQLTGVHFTNKNNKGYVVTTDGFRLSINFTKTQIFPEPITISSFVISEILKSNPSKITTSIIEKEKLIQFNINNGVICTRLIEGEFPPFEKVIPDSTKTKVTINKNEFINNIKLSAIFLKNKSNTLIFEFEKEGVRIRPKNEEKQNSIIFQNIVLFDGEPLKIAFNYKFVLDFLQNVDGDNIIIESNTSTTPCVFKEEKNNQFVHIIMPLRVDELE